MNKSKITAQEKLTTVKMRLEGQSTGCISKKLGYSGQTISNLLHHFAGDRQAPNGKRQAPYCTEAERDEIAAAIVKADGDTEKVYLYTDLPQKLIDEALSYLVGRQSPVGVNLEDDEYPAVTAWMRRNSMSLSTLSEIMGIPCASLSKQLKGRQHLRLEAAMLLKDITGLSLRSIFSKQIKAIDEEIDSLLLSLQQRKALNEGKETKEPTQRQPKRGTGTHFPPKKKNRSDTHEKATA